MERQIVRAVCPHDCPDTCSMAITVRNGKAIALRGDSDAAREHAVRALATADPAECGLVAARARRALGVAALADGSYLQAFTQLRGLFSEDGTPLHNYASYLGVADLAAAAVRADRRMEGSYVIEDALGRLDGTASARLEQLIARARGILADARAARRWLGERAGVPEKDIVLVGRSLGGGVMVDLAAKEDYFTSSLACSIRAAQIEGKVKPGDIGLFICMGAGLQIGCALYYF